MRGPLAPPNQRHVPEREPSRSLQSAERDALNEREDVALERGEVDEPAVPFVPVSSLPLPLDVRLRAPGAGYTVYA